MRVSHPHSTLIFFLSLFWPLPVFALTDLPGAVPEEILEEANNSYIFVFYDDVPAGEIRGQSIRLNRQAGGSLRHVFSKALKGFSANISAQAAAQIGASPKVAYYEPNQIYRASDRKTRARDDDRSAPAGPGRGPGRDDDPKDPEQVTPWGIERIGGPVDGSNLHAWVIDSGIDQDNPDLNLGYGANFVTVGLDEGPEDVAGHGTHVAGTVAAIDNDIDVVAWHRMLPCTQCGSSPKADSV